MTLRQKLFLVMAMLCGFFISCEYAVVRPVSNSVFITAYTSAFLPYAWLATVPLNLILVALYNKYLPRLGCWRCFVVLTSLIGLSNIFAALFLGKIPGLSFLFYVWKEVYIMLMFQQLWSVIHAKMDLKRAKYLYGLLFGAGALGSIIGSGIPSFLAVAWGSENLLFLSVPIVFALFVVYHFLLKFSDEIVFKQEKKESAFAAFRHGMNLIGSSKLLVFILGIVALMQITATLTDYQFNGFLEHHLPTKDLRTEYSGKILGIVHSCTLCLQIFGSFLVVHFLGLKRSHLLIPCLLSLSGLCFLFFPIFPIAALSYILIKSFDFSLFGIIKEMLYIPLSQDDKFRAKSVIDVFAYRTSKALASLLILGLQALLGVHSFQVLAVTNVALFILWAFFVGLFFNKAYQAKAESTLA